MVTLNVRGVGLARELDTRSAKGIVCFAVLFFEILAVLTYGRPDASTESDF